MFTTRRHHSRHRHDDHHHGFGHRHGERGHRSGGPGRFFESGDLRFVILHLLESSPRHGYELIKLIEDRTAGAHTPSPGIIYPTLTLLEEMGSAAVTVEGTRKLYTLTDQGRQELAANRAATETILQRMQLAGERHTRGRSGPVLRAMENLKLVLRMRGETWTPEQLAAVTDILDNAARQIERL